MAFEKGKKYDTFILQLLFSTLKLWSLKIMSSRSEAMDCYLINGVNCKVKWKKFHLNIWLIYDFPFEIWISWAVAFISIKYAMTTTNEIYAVCIRYIQWSKCSWRHVLPPYKLLDIINAKMKIQEKFY